MADGMSGTGDDAIRSTNDDATACKKFAVQQGYWRDPYIQYFAKNAERKPPEINRGYCARVRGIRLLLNQFLKTTQGDCQIVNLGAGFDTLYWNLKDEGFVVKNFVEVDFHAISSRKCYAIKSRKQLLEPLANEDSEIQLSQHDLHAADYHIVGADLRNLPEVEKKLLECGLVKSLPTLFLAECVLVYMDPDRCHELLQWITSNFQAAFFINYEQVNMGDRFGQVMIENLRSRMCSLHGVQFCTSLDTQKQRFLNCGWEGAEAWEMTTVYYNLPKAELQKIESLEFLDEKELLHQLFQHYCLCWAYKDSASVGLSKLSLQCS